MNFTKLFSTVIALCAFFTACDGKKEDSANTLTVGTSADYAPFEFFKDGEIIGFEIDLMREIATRLGKKVTFKDMAFDAILGSLSTKRIDAAISSITPTKERLKSVDFTKEYIQSKRVMLCKATSSIESVSDLADATVGVQSGSIHETYANDTLSKDVRLTVKSLTKVPDLLQDMENGNVSCLILGNSEAEEIMKSRANLKLVSLPGEVSGSAIALPKGSPLTNQINTILDQMETEGFLTKLKEKWQLPS